MNRRQITRTALAITAALALTACGGTEDGDVAAPTVTPPVATAPETAPEDTPAPGQTAPETEAPATEEPTSEPVDPTFGVSPEGQELVLGDASGVRVLYTLPAEGESVFRAAALRPGSTPEDLTVVVVTSAEGMYDLRWLEVVGGEVGELQTFPDAYNLDPATVTGEDPVPAPVWSPDGRSVAWALPVQDGATVQTVGWSDGPGTGDTADDNAAFALEGVPADAQARTWTAAEDDTSVLELVTEDGKTFHVVFERQADGALALR